MRTTTTGMCAASWHRRSSATKSGRSTYCKQKHVGDAVAAPVDAGDVWTWTALAADSKLILAWLVGDRDAGTATEFLRDLRSRLAQRMQLTTDGHRAYLSAVKATFGTEGRLRAAGETVRRGTGGRQGPLQPVGVHRHPA